MKVEVVDLTDAQARTLRTAAQRALDMYGSRSGAGHVTRSLRPVIEGLDEILEGKRDELRLGVGLTGEGREEVVGVLEHEYEIADTQNRKGYGAMDGNDLRALENGLEAMRDPEVGER
jgi:hypothetical protein